MDFIDINLGCPIDVVNEKGAGCALASRATKLITVLRGMQTVMMGEEGIPLTMKVRTGIKEERRTAHETIARVVASGVPPQLITLHPRSKYGGHAISRIEARFREQRYTRLAHWDYVDECAHAAGDIPFWACGDVLTYEDYYRHLEESPIAGVMIGRGALMKPWIFTEIAERRHWDITASERLEIVRKSVDTLIPPRHCPVADS